MILITASAPLTATKGYSAPEQKRTHLARHAAQMRDHIGKLGQKRYLRQFEPSP